MARFRYRTEALVGPWRDSLLKAEIDAVAVGLARVDGHAGRLIWKVPGEIEVGDDPAAEPGPDVPGNPEPDR